MSDVHMHIIGGENVDPLVECEVCGPLGSVPSDEMREVVMSHLENVHQCNLDTMKVVPLTDEHPEEAP